MNAHTLRAQLLIEQSRFDGAENELRKVLFSSPHDEMAHALMAICLCAQDKPEEALARAQESVHLAPDNPICHYVLAKTYLHIGKPRQAKPAILQALRIAPENPDSLSLLAGIRYDLGDWKDSLEAALAGLSFDGEHVVCNNLRAMSLVKLGRREEANQAIDMTLMTAPESAITHANKGWALLEQGRSKPALETFREALRIDPNLELARSGMVESLKARHSIYRLILGYFFWMSRLSRRAQWGIIVGLYVIYRLMIGATQKYPELAPISGSLIGVYLLFVFLSWTASHLFNLLLRWNRLGRLALSSDEIRASTWVGSTLLGSLLLLLSGMALKQHPLVLAGIGCAIFVVPIAGTFTCPPGNTRTYLAAYTLGLGAAGLGSLVASYFASGWASGLAGLFIVGLFFFSWIANLLIMKNA